MLTSLRLLARSPSSAKTYSTNATLKRSYLYVPSSSQKMLTKSLGVPSDVLIYDLEDSVAPKAKADARNQLGQFLSDHVGSMSQDSPLQLAHCVPVRKALLTQNELRSELTMSEVNSSEPILSKPYVEIS